MANNEWRDNLKPEDYAVPEKAKLPIRNTPDDKVHVRMAWSMLDNTKGLTEAEKAEAKRRILSRAKELGLNTDSWEAHSSPSFSLEPAGKTDGGQIQAMRFEAMALEVPETPDHPNKVPFSGIMTRVDQASDNPVGGAKGKHVLIPKEVAEAAIGTLLGMGVDYTPSLSGHDPQKKIGVITAADVVDDAIQIQGFLYGADFPTVVADIQSRKALLGFSYEAQAAVKDWNSDPVEVTRCVFTGAAILLKEKAAYTTTSLEASASTEITDMDMKELLDAIRGVVKEETAPLAADVATLKASTAKIEASSVLHRVKPHTDKIRAAADGLEAEGFGGHEKRGHVAHLRRMADKMEAEAVMGKLPHVYNDHDWLEAGAAGGAAGETEKDKAKDAEIAALKEKVKTLEATAFAAAGQPGRKTEGAGDGKANLGASGDNGEVLENDAKLKASGASTHQRLTAIVAAGMRKAA